MSFLTRLSQLQQPKKMKCPVFEVTEEPKWFDPTCVVLIKGEKASGVSTVFNLLFQSSFRIVSGEGHEPVIANLTERQRIKNESNDGNGKNEIDFHHDFLEDIFPDSIHQQIAYKFIESGNLSEDWFQKWTRFCAGIVFVIDKERLQAEISYQQTHDLVRTLIEIKEAKSATGFNIPLMILVNKVEDIDDPEVKQNLERFEASLKEYLNLNDSNLEYEFVLMSGLNASLYRQFSLNRNFDDMSQHDITRLCGNELGSEGKMYARDLSKHSYLIEELNRRVMTDDGRQRWMTLTGLSPFVDWFDKAVFPKNSLYGYLSTQITLLLGDLVESAQLPSLNQTNAGAKYGFPNSPLSQRGFSVTAPPDSDSISLEKSLKNLEVIVRTHNNYARIVEDGSSMLMENELQNSHQMYLDSIRIECRGKYERIMSKLIDIVLVSSNESSRLSIILQTLGQNKAIDECQLISNDLWENGKINAVMIVLERLWSNNQGKTFSFDPAMEYSFSSFRSPNAQGAVNSVSMTLEAIHHVISNGSREFITSIVEKVLIPLIDTLRPDICRIPLDRYVNQLLQYRSAKTPDDAIDLESLVSSGSSTPTQDSDLWGSGLRFAIMKLEECALQLLPSVLTAELQRKLLESVIKKKLSIRESLSGYSICLKELLGKYPELKERAFFLFCTVLHLPIPQADLTWAAKLTEDISFSQDILNSPFLRSERTLHENFRQALPFPPPPPPPLPNRQIFPANASPAPRPVVNGFKSTPNPPPPFIKSESSPYPLSNSHQLEQMDNAGKRPRSPSVGSSSPVEEVFAQPPEILTLSPPTSPPKPTPVKLTPSRRRLMTSRGEC